MMPDEGPRRQNCPPRADFGQFGTSLRDFLEKTYRTGVVLPGGETPGSHRRHVSARPPRLASRPQEESTKGFSTAFHVRPGREVSAQPAVHPVASCLGGSLGVVSAAQSEGSRGKHSVGLHFWKPLGVVPRGSGVDVAVRGGATRMVPGWRGAGEARETVHAGLALLASTRLWQASEVRALADPAQVILAAGSSASWYDYAHL